jgi:hypothetical protein
MQQETPVHYFRVGAPTLTAEYKSEAKLNFRNQFIDMNHVLI